MAKRNYDGWGLKNKTSGKLAFTWDHRGVFMTFYKTQRAALDSCLQNEKPIKVCIVPVESEVEK